MKRAVPDTNILVSAYVFAGLPASFLDLAANGAFRPVTSPTLLDELDETLRGKFGRSTSDFEAIRSELEALCDVVSTSVTIHAIKDDPDDDRVLECAVIGRADYIVTGDNHLLKLREYEGIRIVTLRQFLDLLMRHT